MKIRDYAENKDGGGFYVSPEVLYAGECLEHHGEIFLLNFGIDNAISKAAEMYTIFLDEQRLEEDSWRDLT